MIEWYLMLLILPYLTVGHSSQIYFLVVSIIQTFISNLRLLALFKSIHRRLFIKIFLAFVYF